MNNHPKHPLREAFLKRGGKMFYVKVLKRQFSTSQRNWRFLIEHEGKQERVPKRSLHRYSEKCLINLCFGACWMEKD